jgi:cytochrome P450
MSDLSPANDASHDLAGFDPRRLDAAFYANPFPLYRALRERSPVHRCPDGSFFLTRYEDVHAVYRNPRLFRSDKRLQFAPVFGAGTPLYEHHTTSLVFNDPPLHTHVRKAIGNALSPRAVIAMEPGLRALVERLLDGIEARGRFDLMTDFAAAIPVEIIGNLLRIPPEERAPLRRWSLAILGALEFGLSADGLERGNRAVAEFLEFLADFVARRRHDLSGDDDDILARLIRWESEDGQHLTDTALHHQCIFLLNAGHETTSNLIANGVHLLLTHPGELQRLRGDPALIDGAIEEVLRCESPNQLGNRTVAEPSELHGVALPAGSILTLCIGAANRDPAVFADPDRFDIARHPNPHFAFGAGIHTCAGLNVARLEAKIAIARLFQRFPSVRLDGEPVRARRARFRGFETVPMAIA